MGGASRSVGLGAGERRWLLSQNRVGNKGVAAAFGGESAHRAMAGNECSFTTQWPEMAGDGADEIGMIAARKIGATDRALK